MPILDLSVDEVLTTTRAVRKRLDLARPVEPGVIRACLQIALQAPTPGSRENWHFVVITDPAQRAALAALYGKAFDATVELAYKDVAGADEQAMAKFNKMMDS